MARPKKQESAQVEIKEVIVDAALETIVQEGVRGATARRIAEQANLSPARLRITLSLSTRFYRQLSNG
ncbi:TetR family transcriptional regulator [Acinetobacter lwoffii]|uniref:TetR family transcriptional regulator n=1 Tax=Acinetobacter lwoffii TaxID=28090 RepID=UPI003BF757CC